jgi:hypothetical protein
VRAPRCKPPARGRQASAELDLVSGASTVQVTSARLGADLLFAGGASQISVAPARLGGADFAAGASLISMRLPRPSGTVTVQLAGGASQVSLSLPAGVPAQLALDGGASSATLLGRTHTGVAGGTVLTSPGWSQASARYEIAAPAGVSSIDVTG